MIQYIGDINLIYITLAMIPFGFIQFVPAIIAGAGALASGISALKNRGGSKEEKAALLRQSKVQTQLAKERGERESQLFRQGQPILGTITAELRSLLSGDKTALTKRFGPQLEQLTKNRTAAEQRIQRAGPAGGATVQSLLELEKTNFGARSNLLRGAPSEATAGLTQLLNILMGAGAAQGNLASQASVGASATLESIIGANDRDRALNAQMLAGLASSAESFGTALASSKSE